MVINNSMPGNLNLNIEKIKANSTAPQTRTTRESAGSFDAILKEKLEGVKFSKHAELRLAARNIKLSETQLQKVNEAVKKADSKGVRDTLVITENAALVVNVKSRTVITAMDKEELKDNVFTNIDGAVIT